MRTETTTLEYAIVIGLILLGAYYLYTALLPLIDISFKTAEVIKGV